MAILGLFKVINAGSCLNRTFIANIVFIAISVADR